MSRGPDLRAWAPFKISLAGEHAVGYGGSSIVTSLDAGLEFTGRGAAGPVGSFRWGRVRRRWTPRTLARFATRVDRAFDRVGPEAWRSWSDEFFAPLRYAVGACRGSNGGLRPFDVTCPASPWIGCGLGTSSAAAASVLYICGQVLGRSLPDEELVVRVRAVDRLRHGGIPSGVDGAVAVRGGAILYRDGHATALSTPRSGVLLVHTGVTRSCAEVISSFARQGTRRIDAFVREMEHVTEEVAAALAAGDLAALACGVERDRRILNRHGLGHPIADEIGRLARSYGASAAKLTGAGTGGAVFALFPDGVPAALPRLLADRGVLSGICSLGRQGLRRGRPRTRGADRRDRLR